MKDNRPLNEVASNFGITEKYEEPKKYEPTKYQMKLMKLLPAGRKFGFGAESAKWGKRGGHAGKEMIGKSVAKFKSAGFKEIKSTSGNSPDGNVVNYGNVLQDKDGNQLDYDSSYGVTASSNSFDMTLKFKMEPPK